MDAKARIPDKRSLIEALNRLLEQPKPIVTPPLQTAIPFIDPKTLAALSPALSILSSTISTKTGSSIEATNEDIAIARPYLFRAIYQDLPLQCKACGIRYPDTIEGKSRMDAHLDKHFKRNMRLKDINKKLLTRDWFVSEDEWILGTEKAVVEKQIHSVFLDNGRTEEEEAKQEIDAKIPAGSDHSGKVCSVCGEPINIVWDDDADCWMYVNAVLIDGQVAHSNCKK